MAFCSQCGADNPATAHFCDQCGARLTPVATSAPPTPAAPAEGPTVVDTPSGPSTCPLCSSPVILGEAFCDNCGASLISKDQPVVGEMTPAPSYDTTTSIPIQPNYPPPQPINTPSSPPNGPIVRNTLAPSRLIVIDSGNTIELPRTDQAIVGRADPVSRFYPDVDLSPHNALQNGVGRRHARLSVKNGKILVEDMNSTNGTIVNGQRLTPRMAQPLNDSDELRMGTLKLRFYW